MSDLSSKELAYLEWRQRDDPHQDQPWALYLVAGGNDAWHLLNAPAPLEVRGASNEPGVHRCDDEHAPVYYDGDECPVCDVLQQWMTEANAPRAPSPPAVVHEPNDLPIEIVLNKVRELIFSKRRQFWSYLEQGLGRANGDYSGRYRIAWPDGFMHLSREDFNAALASVTKSGSAP